MPTCLEESYSFGLQYVYLVIVYLFFPFGFEGVIDSIVLSIAFLITFIFLTYLCP